MRPITESILAHAVSRSRVRAPRKGGPLPYRVAIVAASHECRVLRHGLIAILEPGPVGVVIELHKLRRARETLRGKRYDLIVVSGPTTPAINAALAFAPICLEHTGERARALSIDKPIEMVHPTDGNATIAIKRRDDSTAQLQRARGVLYDMQIELDRAREQRDAQIERAVGLRGERDDALRERDDANTALIKCKLTIDRLNREACGQAYQHMTSRSEAAALLDKASKAIKRGEIDTANERERLIDQIKAVSERRTAITSELHKIYCAVRSADDA